MQQTVWYTDPACPRSEVKVNIPKVTSLKYYSRAFKLCKIVKLHYYYLDSAEPAPARVLSYQKKNLDKKLASSTGDFCILSAPPVWFVCTWVAPERVLHICVPCAAPCARPQERMCSPLLSSTLRLWNLFKDAAFRSSSDQTVSVRLRSPRCARSASAPVWGPSILYGLANSHGHARHFHAGWAARRRNPDA